jgi:DNA mismatch repair ATPase MutS
LITNNVNDLAAFYKASVLLENENWNSELLKKLSTENNNFSHRISKLRKLLQLFDIRLNMVMGAVLNIFMIWDLRIISKLDKWKKTNLDIKKHLEIIGEFEALNSLAILNFNNPNNCFPIISQREFEIDADYMYHPLIDRNEVVANCYSFKGTSRLDIITGPNMSGKSTFLRSIAINMILADTGSTVFADKFTFTPSKILTYLHITDSVKDKISTFRAEIIKLKSILEEIEHSDVPTFFILDEILRGTNSHSKFKGSVAIVKRLLDLKSSGIIATHDVHLGKMENDFPKAIRNFSFDFIVDEKEELVYDYKLKKGINTKVNAEIVLKELGLEL